MRLPSWALQQAYFSALDGNISHNGQVVPIYDTVPSGADYPYIRLADQIVRERGTKDSFIPDIIMQVDVVTGFEVSAGGKKDMYEISDLVTQAIIERVPSALALTGFNLIQSKLDIATFIQDETDTHILYINRIRVKHLIT